VVLVGQLHGDLNEPVLGQNPSQGQKTAVPSLAWSETVGCCGRLKCALAGTWWFFKVSRSNRVLKI